MKDRARTPLFIRRKMCMNIHEEKQSEEVRAYIYYCKQDDTKGTQRQSHKKGEMSFGIQMKMYAALQPGIGGYKDSVFFLEELSSFFLTICYGQVAVERKKNDDIFTDSNHSLTS
jgi:hypothetical protein